MIFGYFEKGGDRFLKKKYGDRSDWKRVIKKAYAQAHIITAEFTGYITLLRIDQVTEPLFVQYGNKKICIVDNGYMWLQHFPIGNFHSVTTMFDSTGHIVQWYIDICQGNDIDERNVPCFDDLYLDIIVLPTGEVIQKDSNELEEALSQGIISNLSYNQAWVETHRLTELIKAGNFELLSLSEPHRKILLGKLTS
jgi:predicted RNA-binding protein associated with RNAse of E/G family